MTQASIEGLRLQPLKIIKDERGSVMHMLRCDSSLYHRFGELYFSEINPGCIKAWKRHKLMTQNFAVPVGQIKLVIYDDRENSSTKGVVAEYMLGRPDNYRLVTIPPLLWYGFECLSASPAIIANLADLAHDVAEAEKLSVKDSYIPYHWQQL